MKILKQAKYIAAIVFLIALFALMIPFFLKVQTKAKVRSVQAFADQIIAKVVENKRNIFELSKTSNQHYFGFGDARSNFSVTSEPQLMVMNRGFMLRVDGVCELFPDIEPPDWDLSELKISLEAYYRLASSDYVTPSQAPLGGQTNLMAGIQYEEVPYIVFVEIKVGTGLEKNYDPILFVDKDKEGFMSVNLQQQPYHVSNGLMSYGEFFASTEAFWPRKKAVLMNPPAVKDF